MKLYTVQIRRAPILITSTVSKPYNGSIVSSLHNAADGNIPTNDIKSGSGLHAIPGWNERVKSAHALARDAFKFWIISGKARQGTEYEETKTSRSNFKYILRMCKRQESTTKADSLANDLIGKDQKSFWKHLTRFNKIATQGAPQMAVDKEANSLSRVYSYYSKFNLPNKKV